jgi:hypothetical protein
VCRVCCGPTTASHALCFACRVVATRLGLPLAPALPVRLCPLPGPLYRVLMGYKESAVDEARRHFARLVHALLAAFLAEHGPCIAAVAGGPIDRVLAVPSTLRPSGPPLAALEGLADTVRVAFGGARWAPDLLRRAAAPVGHMRPDAGAFAVGSGPVAPSALRGSRALLLDDTYVSGARAQSAAAALRRAGAGGVVIVPVGRVVRPDRSPVHATFLQAHPALPDGWCASSVPGAPCARCLRPQTPAPTE